MTPSVRKQQRTGAGDIDAVTACSSVDTDRVIEIVAEQVSEEGTSEP